MAWRDDWEVRAARYLREAAPAQYTALEASGELEEVVRSATTRGLDQYEAMVSGGDDVEAARELCWDDVCRSLVPAEGDE